MWVPFWFKLDQRQLCSGLPFEPVRVAQDEMSAAWLQMQRPDTSWQKIRGTCCQRYCLASLICCTNGCWCVLCTCGIFPWTLFFWNPISALWIGFVLKVETGFVSWFLDCLSKVLIWVCQSFRNVLAGQKLRWKTNNQTGVPKHWLKHWLKVIVFSHQCCYFLNVG